MNALERLVNGTLLIPFPGPTPPPTVLRALEAGVGGVTLFAINGNVHDLPTLTARLREAADDPLVTIDEEGGDVTRLAHATGSPYPGNAALGVLDDVETTRLVHRSLGADLAAVGVTVDFAPSADVNSADDNPIIGTRSFGADPEVVARHVAAAVRGLQEAGVAACAKHFPGHGATTTDSHLEVPTVDADLDLLERRDLVPFRAAIAADVRAVMTGHVRIPDLTGENPATLSPEAITGLLRGTLGYTGVVVTDALDMWAASGRTGIPEAAVRSLLAGSDLLCLGARETEESVREIQAAIVAAVEEGRIPVARLEEAAERVRELKEWLATTRSPVATDPDVGLRAARSAVRVDSADGARINVRAPLVLELQAPANIAVGPVPWGLGAWATPPVVGMDVVPVDVDDADPAGLIGRAEGRSLVIVARNAHRYPGHRQFISELLAVRPDAVVVEMGLPVWRPDAATYVATYGATRANAQAAAEVLGLAD